MVREIEKVLGKSIDRRRLPEFDYGAFVPEAQFQPRQRGERPVNSRPQRDDRQPRDRKGYQGKRQQPDSSRKQHSPRGSGEGRFADGPRSQRPQRRKRFSAAGIQP
jgi:hypothetical protein